MTEALQPSTSNWIWLADLARYDSAFVLGEALERLQPDLSRHFRAVQCAPALTAGQLPVATASLDCLCLDARLVLESSSGRRDDRLLAEARRVVRAGGCVFLPVEHAAPRRWWRRWHRDGLPRRLRRAGFRRVRTYYVFPDHGYFDSVVPARGRPAAGYVVWGEGVTPRARVRRLATLLGGHRVSYSSWFFLAYP